VNLQFERFKTTIQEIVIERAMESTSSSGSSDQTTFNYIMIMAVKDISAAKRQ
jgi:hypothetical protein